MSTLRERREANITRSLRPVAHLVKSWFLNVGYDFMSKRNYNANEEQLIEELSDYYLERIKDLD